MLRSLTVVESNTVAAIRVLVSDPVPGWDIGAVLDADGAVGANDKSRPLHSLTLGNGVPSRVDNVHELEEAVASLERNLVRVVCNVQRKGLRGGVLRREDLGCPADVVPLSIEETNLAAPGGEEESVQVL